MFISKGSYVYGEPKNVIGLSVQKTHSHLRASKLPEFVYRRIWSIIQIWENWRLLIPMFRICTKAMFISKGSYVYGEPKNVIGLSVQKTHSQLRASKLPEFVYRRIWSIMEIWENWRLPIPQVPRLHQANVYTKRKLRVWGS